jgi:hypothetical protein
VKDTEYVQSAYVRVTPAQFIVPGSASNGGLVWGLGWAGPPAPPFIGYNT